MLVSIGMQEYRHCSNIQIHASGAQTITEKVSIATEAASLEAASFKEKHTPTHTLFLVNATSFLRHRRYLSVVV